MSQSILDSIGEIKKVDSGDMLSYCINSAEQYREAMRNAEKIQASFSKPENVIIAGMGGSAIGGELVKDYTRSTSSFPIEVNRDYDLPEFAGKNTLVFLISYSGETEETLSTFLHAVKRGCSTFCISSGGALLQYCKRLSLPYLQVKSGMPPRAALPHLLVPLMKCMEKIGATSDFSENFDAATASLEKIGNENSAERPEKDNFAKTLASNLNNTSPVTYGFGNYRSVALRYKQQFNENTKLPAKWETFSELNHNEIMGWEAAKELSKCYSIIFLRDEKEPVEIRSRIETTKSLIKTEVNKIFEVWAQGNSKLSKMLSTILIGDFTSVYLAILRKVNPTPVNMISTMKNQIEKNGAKHKIIAELENMAKP